MHTHNPAKKRYNRTAKQLILLFLFTCLGLSLFGTRLFLRATNDHILRNTRQQAFDQLVQKEKKNQPLTSLKSIHTGSKKMNPYGFFYSEEESDAVVAQLEKQTQAAAQQLETISSAVISYISEEAIAETLIHRNFVTKEYHWAPEQAAFVLAQEAYELFELRSYETREPLTFKEAAKDETSLRSITRCLQEALLEAHDSPETILEEVLTLPDLTFEEEVVVLPHALKLRTDPLVFGFETIDLAYTDLFPAINPLLLDPEFIEEQEKKKNDATKKVALTFDDGPNTQSTMRLLHILEQEQVEATFFVLGQMVTAHPAAAAAIVEQGHEIANHSYSHPDLTRLSNEAIRNEVKKTDEAIFRTTGVLPQTFRAPYGAVTQDVIKQVGLPMIHWEVDSLDWQLRDPQAISSKVLAEVRPGSIILMHDIHESSIDAVPAILSGLREKGYEFVTITTLLSEEQQPYHQYFSATSIQKIE